MCEQGPVCVMTGNATTCKAGISCVCQFMCLLFLFCFIYLPKAWGKTAEDKVLGLLSPASETWRRPLSFGFCLTQSFCWSGVNQLLENLSFCVSPAQSVIDFQINNKMLLCTSKNIHANMVRNHL